MGVETEVLVVDDDRESLAMLRALLERHGFAVSTADRGADALATLERAEPDCVVADYDMPSMDGLDLLEEVRSREPQLPFILFTGKGSEALASEAITAGVTDYVRKGPAGQLEVLPRRIENALETVRARREKQKSEQVLAQYRSLVERSGDPMYALDSDGHCLLANDALAGFTGYSREEIEGEHLSEFVDDEEYERATEALRRQVATGERQSTVEFVVDTDEGERIGEANVTALTDEAGQFVGSVGIVRDISARKRRERELAHYEAIVETAPVGILVLDESGRVKGTNEVFVKDLDYTVADVDGRRFLEFVEEGVFDEGIVSQYRRIVRKLLSSEAEIDEIARNIEVSTTTGETRYFDAHTALLPLDEGGEYAGTVTAFRDITQQVRYRRELERQNERLERFARFVSHDLRNPINVAQGHLELLEEPAEPDTVETIGWAVDRMEELIDDLLAVARHGQTVEDPDAVRLRDVARSAWVGVETAAADIEIVDDLRFEADRTRVCQLLENLYRNAVEHGGAEVTVRVGTLEADRRGGGGFFVEDDGPGLDDPDSVFEFGYTTDPSGTGFGLGIVDQIAGAHDWRVRATNGARGARFEITGLTRA